MAQKPKAPTAQEQIAEFRRLAEQMHTDAMDAPTPEIQKKLEKDAANFERMADELEQKLDR